MAIAVMAKAMEMDKQRKADRSNNGEDDEQGIKWQEGVAIW